jgi:nucleotide-binding universal stress UspA family protein
VAEIVARATGAKIRLALVHQLPPPPADRASSQLYQSVELSVRKAESEYLHLMAKRVHDGDPSDTGTAFLEGPVGPALNEYAREIGADMIVMSTHGRGGVDRLWLGSVADYLVRTAELPVLLVRPTKEERPAPAAVKPRRVLVPLDGSLLAEAVLEPATVLATSLGAEVLLVQVVKPVAIVADQPALFAAGYDERLTALWRQEAEDYLEDLAEDLRAKGVRASSVAATGYAVHETLLDLATADSGTMIALATHGRGGLRRLMVGSVADKLIRTAEVPVLVVRPAKAPKRATRPPRRRARQRA